MPINILKDWKENLECAYSFMLKYSKITVWALNAVTKSFIGWKPPSIYGSGNL